MHACGHDIHTSALLSMLEYINNNKFTNNIALIFQSKEETGLGSKDIINTNIFEELNITKVIAMHVWPNLEYDKIFTSKNLMFGSYELDVFINGKSNHVSSYNKKTDAIYTTFLLYKKLFKNNANYITHLGKIKSGTIRNISSNFSELNYTIRFKNYRNYQQKIKKIKINTNCNITYDFKNFFPPLINDNELMKLINYNKIKTLKSSEDFGYYAQKSKTLYLLYGLGKTNNLHTNNFTTTKKQRESYLNKLIFLLNIFKEG